MKTTTKNEIYIIGSVFFLLYLFLVLFFAYPAFMDIGRESQNLASQKNNTLSLEKEFNEAGGFQRKYQEYQPNLQKIDNLLIDSQNPVDFIKFLEKTAGDLGLKLEISSPLFFQEGDFYFANFQLSLGGGFSGVMRFIKTLEAGPYLIKVKNLSANKNLQEGTVKFSASIKVFAKK